MLVVLDNYAIGAGVVGGVGFTSTEPSCHVDLSSASQINHIVGTKMASKTNQLSF